MKCIKCNRSGICRNKMAAHITGCCPMTLINCHKCEQGIKRKDKQSHLDNDCPEALIKRTFYQFGCRDTLKRKDEKNHIENAAFTHNHLVQLASHQLKLVDTVNAIKNENKVLNARIVALEDQQIITDNKIAKLPRHYSNTKVVYADAAGNLYRYENELNKLYLFLPNISVNQIRT
eukprot:UN04335